MTEETKTRKGGARAGAGRKAMPDAEKTAKRSVYLNDTDYADFLALGASEWLRKQLKIAKHGNTQPQTDGSGS